MACYTYCILYCVLEVLYIICRNSTFAAYLPSLVKTPRAAKEGEIYNLLELSNID